MNVSAWGIKNPIAVIMIFVMLTFAGVVSYNSMKIQDFPDLDFPNITVLASQPGASPAQMETDVARKIEHALAGLSGLKNLYTKIQDGVVTITAEFRLEKDTQEALDEVRSAVQQVRSDLPGDLRDPVVDKISVAGLPILAYTISSNKMDAEALSWFVDDTLNRRLLAVKGVGAVSRVGGVNREVRVALDAHKMQALGVSALAVSRQLNAIQLETAGGRANLGRSEQPMRTVATVKSVQELAQMEIALGDGRKLRLDQVATVQDTLAEQRSAAFLNGKRVVGFEISRSKGASEIEVGRGVHLALEETKKNHDDIELNQAFDFVTPVKEGYAASLTLLFEGAILAVLVVWLFLRDWRATIVASIALPLSVVPAFLGMAYMGFSINVVTLLALSLVVGLLVDDAIVEVENIERHIRMGKTPYQAAMEAADEIGLAVIATTFTLIAVFLPTAFMSGVAGKYFVQFGWTASLAVFASLVVARMLTPMMAAYMMKGSKNHQADGQVMRWYMRTVRLCIEHRGWTALGSLVFFMGSLALIPLLPTGFMPPDNNNQTQVNIELPPGAALADTFFIAEQAQQLISKVDHVKSIYTTIGSDSVASSSAALARRATLMVTLVPRKERPIKQQIENDIRKATENLPGVRIKVGFGGSGERYVVSLVGDDLLALSRTAAALERDLRTIPGLGSVISTAALVRPEVMIRPDFAKMADLGVTSQTIGETLRVATVGDYDQALAKLNLSSRQIPIVVRLDDTARADLSQIERLMVRGTNGPVMLGQVAHIEVVGGPAEIDRFDRRRNVQIEAELSGIALGDVKARMAELPSIKNLPPGVNIVELGDAEAENELFTSFGLAMLTGVASIYIVLVLLFKATLQPITILMALPLSLGGAFIGLLIAQKSFSMPSLIGLIMLMGVTTKNSILLVDYAILGMRADMNRWDAILDACHKRARPIVMTTIAMGAGMLPIALGWGPADQSFRSPMAVAVIGGLITSTVLSLLVIPAIFTFVDDFARLIARLQKRLSSRPLTRDKPPAQPDHQSFDPG